MCKRFQFDYDRIQRQELKHLKGQIKTRFSNLAGQRFRLAASRLRDSVIFVAELLKEKRLAANVIESAVRDWSREVRGRFGLRRPVEWHEKHVFFREMNSQRGAISTNGPVCWPIIPTIREGGSNWPSRSPPRGGDACCCGGKPV